MLNWMMNCLNRWMKPQTLGGPALELRTPAPQAAAPQPPPDPAAPVVAEPPLAREEVKRAANMVQKVGELTTAVAEDVGQHHSNIQSLNVELSGVAQGDANAVAAVIGKLLAANQELQTRLERAELKLQAHSRQLQDVAVASRTDALTGLMNRRALDEELRRSVDEFQRRGRHAALMLLDVDHFKRFNDTHGHVAGDEALKYVGDVLRTQSRETDIVARFGGEEFAVIFAATSAAAVRTRAEEIRAAIGQGRVSVEGQQIRITASAGLAEIEFNEEISQWLKRADAALYSAKDYGRNCSFWCGPTGLERNEANPAAAKPGVPVAVVAAEPESAPRPARESAAELAADAFADATFVLQIGRRIAEWRRGGATFSVILARLDGRSDSGDDEHSPRQRAIRTVMQLARGCVREMDVLTRWTSEGIAVLLPGAGVPETRVVARRLHMALAKLESTATEMPIRVAVSTGIAEGIEGNDAARVLQRAWLALEAAESVGPGMIFLHDGLKPLAINPPALAR
jgi:diguanylate cyclase